MAIFDELATELQESIWELVLPPYGGIHWVDIEGFPRSTEAIRETLDRVSFHFNDVERSCLSYCICDNSPKEHKIYSNYVYGKKGRGDFSTPYFEDLYPIVPSVLGRAESADLLFDHENAKEIIDVRRCRQLSTYTQITSLLSTCTSSRRSTLRWLNRTVPGGQWRLFRGEGAMCRPRPLSIWKSQYQASGVTPPERQIRAEELGLGIFAASDLIIFRLHTASGHPTTTLKHSFFQLHVEWPKVPTMLPNFKRVGIEWNPVWATESGWDAFYLDAVHSINMLTSTIGAKQFYWLVDGIPRPKWEQYPPCIPAAYNYLIDKSELGLMEQDQLNELRAGESLRDKFPEQHDLYHDLEANGRRYYVVFLFTNVSRFDTVEGYDETKDSVFLETNFPSRDVCWKDLFPGGKDLWPEALYEPVEFANKAGFRLGAGSHCTYVLSWEPI
ncbi:hypothetical protein GLAREA_12877 [Glarea lozoyensis ATCC 20868]|uniref:Uncharacterized protein n=1 Tax=Glarea lozoyensis (strain ATCC 20868 / MF5171) TaxID=1116229 RepID=S3CYY5_GLAL2|nr:uncharacterized protein GLAREA_12877 [Glarea lozoyensis ATCC 20868]EPE30154.1 hypothetical protein GLAREA_12877 [Glarea lozoyensis ATCC 20868]